MKKLNSVELRCYNPQLEGDFPYYSEGERNALNAPVRSVLHLMASRKFNIAEESVRSVATPVTRTAVSGGNIHRGLVYFVTGNGRKSALDSLAIENELRSIDTDVEIRFVSHGSGAEVLRSAGREVVDLELPDRPPLFAVQDKFALQLAKWERDFQPLLIVAHQEPCLARPAGRAQKSDWPYRHILIVDDISGAGPDMHTETLVLSTGAADPVRRILHMGPILRTNGLQRKDRAAARKALKLPLKALILSVIVAPGSGTELTAPVYELLQKAFDKIEPAEKPFRATSKRLLWDPAAGVRAGEEFDAGQYVSILAASDLVITKGDSSVIIELELAGIPLLSILHSGQEPLLFQDRDLAPIYNILYDGLDAEGLKQLIAQALDPDRRPDPRKMSSQFQNAARNAAERLNAHLLSFQS